VEAKAYAVFVSNGHAYQLQAKDPIPTNAKWYTITFEKLGRQILLTTGCTNADDCDLERDGDDGVGFTLNSFFGDF
jgi:hypothetical protein